MPEPKDKRLRDLRGDRRRYFRTAARAAKRGADAVRRRANRAAQRTLAAIRRRRTALERREERVRARKRDSIAGTSFTWGEAKAKSWYPWLPAHIKTRVILHAKNLERLRSEINAARKRQGFSPTGINILSWVRSWAKNRAIGGASQSRHLSGDATDIAREEVARLCPWNPREFDAIANRVFSNGGFGQYPGGSRHVDSRGSRSRWTSF